MGIEKNLKFITEEFMEVRGKLERLENFMASEEFKTGTDDSQKDLLNRKVKVLRDYISIIDEQIKYDKEKLQDADSFNVKSYEELEKEYFRK